MYPGGGSGGGFNIPPGPPGGYPNTQQPPAGFGVPPGNVIKFVCFSSLSLNSTYLFCFLMGVHAYFHSKVWIL